MLVPDPAVAAVWIVAVLLITGLLGVLAGLEAGKRIARREAAEARAGITTRGREKAPEPPAAPEPAQQAAEDLPPTPLLGVVPPSGATRFDRGENPYTRLRPPEEPPAAQQPARKPATNPIPVVREPISHDGGLLGMSLPELMELAMTQARNGGLRTDTTALPVITSDGARVGTTELHLPEAVSTTATAVVIDRRVHAELPDGSEVVRYEKAGRWFHEGPGLRRRLTLPEAADLARTPGTRVHTGLPGGGIFDLRVRS